MDLLTYVAFAQAQYKPLESISFTLDAQSSFGIGAVLLLVVLGTCRKQLLSP